MSDLGRTSFYFYFFVSVLLFYFSPVGTELESRLYTLRTIVWPSEGDPHSVGIIDEKGSPSEKLDRLRLFLDPSSKREFLSLNIFLIGSPADFSKRVLLDLEKLESIGSRVHVVMAHSVNGSECLSDKEKVNGFFNTFREQGVVKSVPLKVCSERGFIYSSIAKDSNGNSQNQLILRHWALRDIPRFKLVNSDLSKETKGRHLFMALAPNAYKLSNHLSKHLPQMVCSRFEVCLGGYEELAAVATINLLQGNGLKKAPSYIGHVQASVLSIGFLGVWFVASKWAALLMLVFWALLFLFHVGLTHITGFIVPLAETVYFSCFLGLSGGLSTFSKKRQKMVELKEKFEAQRDVGGFQEKFLEKFSGGLAQINDTILQRLQQHQINKLKDSTTIELYKRLETSGKELKDYLGGIVNFSQMTSLSPRSFKKSRFFLRPLLQKIQKRFSDSGNKSITIDLDCSRELEIYSYPTVIDLVISNLVANAVKYSPSKGQVQIRVAQVGRRALSISVYDEGQGIPKEYHDLIFEKFYRVPDSNINVVRGNGLGLYLGQFFANLAGGYLSIVSEVGVGSVFTMTINKAIKE